MKRKPNRTILICLAMLLVLGAPFFFGICCNFVNIRPVFMLPGSFDCAFRFQQGLFIYYHSDYPVYRDLNVEWLRDSISLEEQASSDAVNIPTSIKPISFTPFFISRSEHPEIGRIVMWGFSSFLAVLILSLPLIVALTLDRRTRRPMFQPKPSEHDSGLNGLQP